MSFKDFSRNQIRKLLTKEKNMILENKIPSYEILEGKFQDISEFGLYLHIPFCKQICPYCPYNKEIYHTEVARMYSKAVKKLLPDQLISWLKNENSYKRIKVQINEKIMIEIIKELISNSIILGKNPKRDTLPP